jgi:hypothetical protein
LQTILDALVLKGAFMLISMLALGVLMVVLGVLYFKTVQEIERDDIHEARARVERLKNKRAANHYAGA